MIWGVIFEIDPAEKPSLDTHEGLGHGYVERQITVIDGDGNYRPLFMYAAEETYIDPALRPYSWYVRFVVEGARQHCLPAKYIATLEAVEAIEDLNRERDARNRRNLC